MSGFAASWLALRQPYDAAARDNAATRRLVAWRPAGARLRVIDLGAGTGANLRFLAPLLGGAQDWLLVDHDPVLLDAAVPALRGWAAARGLAVTGGDGMLEIGSLGLRRQRLDLAAGLDGLALAGADLVTAAALADLVSAAWFDALAARCAAAGAALAIALSYDGAMVWDPPDPDDAAQCDRFNRHQRTDKGFGPALGPAATAHMTGCLDAFGYRVTVAASAWRCDAGDGPVQQAILDGCAAAAHAIDPDAAAAIESWRRRRLAHLAAGRSRLTVGHADLVALQGRLGSALRNPTDEGGAA